MKDIPQNDEDVDTGNECVYILLVVEVEENNTSYFGVVIQLRHSE
jgi:hypothetical protein